MATIVACVYIMVCTDAYEAACPIDTRGRFNSYIDLIYKLLTIDDTAIFGIYSFVSFHTHRAIVITSSSNVFVCMYVCMSSQLFCTFV